MMLALKLTRNAILVLCLAVLCATGNAGVEESTVQICNKHTGGLMVSTHGTGVVYERGMVLTAKHVVDCCRQEIVVRDCYGRFHPAYVVEHGSQDWTCLYVPSLDAPYIPSRLTPLRERELVTAYGDFRGPAVGDGLESAPGYVRNAVYQKDCQNFTGDVRPGYSGGPVIDANGHLVGITSWECLFNNESGFVRITDVFRRFIR